MHFSKPPLGTPLDWENPLNRDLELHLGMQEGNGDKVQDLSLNGNHGTMNNFAFPPTTTSGWNPGKTGVGINFNGTNNYIGCGNGPSLQITDVITASVYIYPVSADDADLQYVLNKGVFRMYYDGKVGGNRATFHVSSGGAGKYAWSPAGSVPVDTWTHIVGVMDGANVITYVNGVGYVGDAATNIDVDGQDLFIGKHSGAGRVFEGSIDQPRIQSRAWTAKEVKDYAINPWQVYLDEGDM